MNPLAILQNYWDHKAFRPLQEEIINAVISKYDTLAILPTGGGKSVCFQIPGLYFEGITLVVSPLIALMNDQVENLKKRDISAIAFHSGITKREAAIEYTNIKNGKYKFVYVSPERIKTELFKEVIAETPIKLIAVDEAHCISQWGYDFRPEYLLISELREILKGVPCIALTASATPQVEKDIKEFLLFNAQSKAFKQTTIRPNLNYVVLDDENKNERLLKIATKLKGTGIIYAKNRKTTVLLASLLNKNGVVADFYHAGLELENRHLKQQSWQKGFTRVIVCTNAFGMGIDKSNVRFVVHYDMPESLEAYYQEAGRAGRDGEESWCVLLYCNPDKISAEKLLNSKYLDKKTVQTFFNALCNQLQMAYNCGFDETFELDTIGLAKKYNFQLPEIQTALGMLQKEGVLKLSDSYVNPSRLRILVDNMALYKFYLANPTFELFIKTILRMYGGIFDNYIHISEFEIAKNLKIPLDRVKEGLERLTKMQLFDYLPQNEKPAVTLLMPRPEIIPYDSTRWKFLKQAALDRLKAVFNYATANECRQELISKYFGETDNHLCGKCDVCRAKKKTMGSVLESVKEVLSKYFSQNYCSFETIIEQVGNQSKNLEALRFLMDTGQLKKNKEGNYIWHETAKK